MILADITNWELTWLLLLFGALAAVWLYALVSCMRRNDLSGPQKLAWVLVILCTNYLGLIAYFIASSNREKKAQISRYPKAIDPVTGRPPS